MCPLDTYAPATSYSKQGHNSGTIKGILIKFDLGLCIVIKTSFKNLKTFG